MSKYESEIAAIKNLGYVDYSEAVKILGLAKLKIGGNTRKMIEESSRTIRTTSRVFYNKEDVRALAKKREQKRRVPEQSMLAIKDAMRASGTEEQRLVSLAEVGTRNLQNADNNWGKIVHRIKTLESEWAMFKAEIGFHPTASGNAQ